MPIVTAKIKDDWGPNNLEIFIQKAAQSPYLLIAIVEGDTIHYQDKNVKVISNGQSWCLLDDYIESLKINKIHDQWKVFE
jgi:hypothetical protein